MCGPLIIIVQTWEEQQPAEREFLLAKPWEVVSLSPTELWTEAPKESLFVFLGDVSPGV